MRFVQNDWLPPLKRKKSKRRRKLVFMHMDFVFFKKKKNCKFSQSYQMLTNFLSIFLTSDNETKRCSVRDTWKLFQSFLVRVWTLCLSSRWRYSQRAREITALKRLWSRSIQKERYTKWFFEMHIVFSVWKVLWALTGGYESGVFDVLWYHLMIMIMMIQEMKIKRSSGWGA